MRDVGEQKGAYFIGHGTQGGIIPIATVSRSPANDEFGFYFPGFVGHFAEIDQAGFFFYPIKMRFVEFAAEVYG